MADVVLMVGGERTVISVLRKALKKANVDADYAEDAESFCKLIDSKVYNLVILGNTLYKESGKEIIEKARACDYYAPVMLINCKSSDDTLIEAFSYGIDDYMHGLPGTDFFVAKVKATIRLINNISAKSRSIVTVGPFSYNSSTLKLFKGKQEISLSSKENAIIKLFIDNPGVVFSKEDIYRYVWSDAIIDNNAIMVYINRIRSKIEDDPTKPEHLVTVRGKGYRLNAK